MKKFERFVFACDVHGDQQNPQAVGVLLDFMQDWKPTVRICGGDVWDFRPLRRKASDDEKRESMEGDFHAGLGFLNKFKPTHWLLGNHEYRLWHMAATSDGVLGDYSRACVTGITKWSNKQRCIVLPYHKRLGVVRLGHLKCIHGFWVGIHADKQAAMVYGSCLMGHTHSVSEFAIPGLERRVARSCGCLCHLDMEYNLRTPSSLRHANGFAFGVVDRDTGLYHVWQAECINGTWVIPTNLKVYEKHNQ